MLSYERILPFNTALRITPFVVLGTGVFREGYRSGFGVDVGYKIFFQNVRREGKAHLYVGPYFMFKQLDRTITVGSIWGGRNTSTFTIDVYGMGVDVGFKYIYGYLVIDCTIGAGMRYPILSNRSYSSGFLLASSDDYKGIIPRVQCSMGIAF